MNQFIDKGQTMKTHNKHTYTPSDSEESFCY